MSKKPESRLQLRVQRALRNEWHTSYIRKIHGNEYQHTGIADLLCCIEGLFFAIEVKMPGKELTDLQQNEAMEVDQAGGYALVVTSPESAVEQVRHVLAMDRPIKTRAAKRSRA